MTGGAFAVGDGSTRDGASVTFWSPSWASTNTLSGGAAPSDFKGFEESLAVPACGTHWTARTGNSGYPPATIPTYTALVVASSVSRQHGAVAGDTVSVVIVRTDQGYGPDPGHDGTGTVIATFC